jgi:hypothetical protein
MAEREWEFDYKGTMPFKGYVCIDSTLEGDIGLDEPHGFSDIEHHVINDWVVKVRSKLVPGIVLMPSNQTSESLFLIYRSPGHFPAKKGGTGSYNGCMSTNIILLLACWSFTGLKR